MVCIGALYTFFGVFEYYTTRFSSCTTVPFLFFFTWKTWIEADMHGFEKGVVYIDGWLYDIMPFFVFA